MFKHTYKALICLLLAGSAIAETEVTVSGEIRARWELDGRSLDTADANKEATYLRTRVNIAAAVDSNTHAYVQFQDSRTLGAQGQSATLDNKMNVDVHQAYVQIDHLWENGLGVRGGRFEVNLGNQRVFGGVGWSNVGRSWEGWQTWWSNDKATVSLSWLKALELNADDGNRDFDVVLVNADIPGSGIDFFVSLEHDANVTVDANPVDPFNDLDRLNFGLHYKRVLSNRPLDFEFNGVYQTGKMTMDTNSVAFEADIAAYLLAAEIGYTLEGSGKARLAVGIDLSSGDDTATDYEVNSYYQMYYTGHKFRGFMDYFVSSNPQGLMDMMFRASVVPNPDWTVMADVHLFRTAEEYYDALSGSMTSDVGMEIDLTIKTRAVMGVGLQGGLSFFSAKDAWAGMMDASTGTWGYVQAVANF